MASTYGENLPPLRSESVNRWSACLKLLRPHQWAKNLLLFVPFLTAHRLSWIDLAEVIWPFVCFCLASSSIYLINDYVDRHNDRLHPTKRFRPFAAGRVSSVCLWCMCLVAAFASLMIAIALVPGDLVYVLLGYMLTSILYSLTLKKLVLVDVFVLAALYCLRLAAGHVAGQILYSPWLMAFAFSVFLSLAIMKRVSELLKQATGVGPAGRGYRRDDLLYLGPLGIGSGITSAMIFAIYVSSEQVTRLYDRPNVLLFVAPCLLYWIARLWHLTFRGGMHDDPVLFAVKDRVSYVTGAVILGIMLVASKGTL